ncbi:hypothetical protein DGWBC_1582 [Dehalogenimonas sp. WBC-2]|nr:hypothetical protein DGWBC_1582 [Dehalogenimonas sp. WBC-2]
MKVLLIFPPQWTPYRPYLSLPSLSAYLKEHGIDVIQKDFNLETYDLMLSEKYLLNLQERLNARFEVMDSRDKLLPGFEQRYFNDLFIAKSKLKTISSKVEGAKEALRNSAGFYNPETIVNARNTLEQALAIISTAFPIRLDLSTLEMLMFRGTLKELKEITLNKVENPFIELFENNLLPFISEQAPDVIGISIAGNSQFIPAMTLARLIKSTVKDVHVVIGGHMVTLLAESLKKNKELFGIFFDSAIVYEGERPLLTLVEHLRDDMGLDGVPNLIYANDGKVLVNEISPPENLNSLPTPCFDDLPLDSYFSPEPVLPILASRGCYWNKCAFCSQNVIYQGRYHCRDAQKIVEDMRNLTQKYGARHFAFTDEAISPSMMNKLSNEIIENKLKVCCSTNVRMERQFTPDLCQKIHQAGFKLLYLGLESGCNRVLEIMNKGMNTKMAAEACHNFYQAGIWNHLYVMFGFPGETEEELTATIDFLLSNKDIIHSFHVDNFSLGKGMEVQRSPSKYGIQFEEDSDRCFNISYDFSVSSGVAYDQARELAANCMETIGKEFEGDEILAQVTHHYLPLYLLHYEKSDPLLKSILPTNKSTAVTHQRVNRHSVPRIKHGLVLDSNRFNLLEIQQNIADGTDILASPKPTSLIFDPDTGKVMAIPKQALEVISLCDGNISFKKIVQKLAHKHGIPFNRAEEDCAAFLEAIVQNEFMDL